MSTPHRHTVPPPPPRGTGLAELLAAQRARYEWQEAALTRAALDAGLDALPRTRIPVNLRGVTPVTSERRAAFEARLRAGLARLAADVPAADAADDADDTDDTRDTAPGDAVPDAATPAGDPRDGHPPDTSTWAEYDAPTTSLLGACCALCRGACCAGGGDHAYLTGDWLATRRAEAHALDDEAFVARYLAHLPATHYEGACVFQAEDGCALPRDDRSPLCNRYWCGELTQLARRTVTARADDPASVRVVVGASDSVRVHRLGVATTDGLQLVSPHASPARPADGASGPEAPDP